MSLQMIHSYIVFCDFEYFWWKRVEVDAYFEQMTDELKSLDEIDFT